MLAKVFYKLHLVCDLFGPLRCMSQFRKLNESTPSSIAEADAEAEVE
jgi:hypothetical protein